MTGLLQGSTFAVVPDRAGAFPDNPGKGVHELPQRRSRHPEHRMCALNIVSAQDGRPGRRCQKCARRPSSPAPGTGPRKGAHRGAGHQPMDQICAPQLMNAEGPLAAPNRGSGIYGTDLPLAGQPRSVTSWQVDRRWPARRGCRLAVTPWQDQQRGPIRHAGYIGPRLRSSRGEVGEIVGAEREARGRDVFHQVCVPGIGSMTGERCSSQARATWVGATPSRRATAVIGLAMSAVVVGATGSHGMKAIPRSSQYSSTTGVAPSGGVQLLSGDLHAVRLVLGAGEAAHGPEEKHFRLWHRGHGYGARRRGVADRHERTRQPAASHRAGAGGAAGRPAPRSGTRPGPDRVQRQHLRPAVPGRRRSRRRLGRGASACGVRWMNGRQGMAALHRAG
jgi:hypothetical protein